MKQTPLKRVSRKRARQILIEARLRQELLEQCKGVCMLCGKYPDWRGLSLYHVKRKSRGGERTKDNCVLSCGKCHSLDEGIKEV